MVKADGSLAGYDEPGELVVKSISVALGYANNAAASVCSLCRIGSSYLNTIVTARKKPLSMG